MSDSEPEFLYRQPRMDDVENVEAYKPGGYHPIDIGDKIGTGNQQYQVVHKLGYGGFSTVWLVHPLGETSSYFALKVLRADVVHVNELEVLQHLKAAAGPGHPNVVVLHDPFKVSGPNGEHHCLVFPVLGPSLYRTAVLKALPSPVRHRICEQLSSALAFLHSHGICHGDLTPSNVVFELPAARLDQFLTPINAENLKLGNGSRSRHAPMQVIQAPEFLGFDYSSLWKVRIIDFGEAFFTSLPPSSLGSPIEFFPPELCFGYSPSAKADIWQLACVFYMVHSGRFLFPVFFEIYEILIGTIVNCVGPLPQHWRGRFKFESFGYRERGREQNKTDPEWWFDDKAPKNSVDSQLTEHAPHLSTHQREHYVRLLCKMLDLEPNARLSAADVGSILGQHPEDVVELKTKGDE
ncbi:kinase-like protein [Byssothecium circinans]|uniref:EKC/KEOPS complex subunit BUD32 n=1 Tax=Byssothecium circinans TaxID=147558 RepID=A0A6A5URP8_9PLEO|nr:kinase-like protein [Byssothecium circinans]